MSSYTSGQLPEQKATKESEVEGGSTPSNQGEGENGPLQLISKLMPIEQQVGSNVIAALEHPDTVAVLLTVVMTGDGAQHIVSIGLDPGLLGQVQNLLRQGTEERTQRIPCVGFHCFLKDRHHEGGSDDVK